MDYHFDFTLKGKRIYIHTHDTIDFPDEIKNKCVLKKRRDSDAAYGKLLANLCYKENSYNHIKKTLDVDMYGDNLHLIRVDELYQNCIDKSPTYLNFSTGDLYLDIYDDTNVDVGYDYPYVGDNFMDLLLCVTKGFSKPLDAKGLISQIKYIYCEVLAERVKVYIDMLTHADFFDEGTLYSDAGMMLNDKILSLFGKYEHKNQLCLNL